MVSVLNDGVAVDRRELEASFKEIVIDALVVNCIYRAEHETNPGMALADLIAWEQRCALDPAIISEAQALIDRGRERVKVVDQPIKCACGARPVQDCLGEGHPDCGFGEIPKGVVAR
jgi:hypothetical protein